MERTCLECGDPVVGRADKKFCCDTCRNAHHNATNRVSKNLIRTTNNRLQKNHRILEGLNPSGKTKVTKATLLQLGFSFDLITECRMSDTDNPCSYVYDQGYVPLENDSYLLVKKTVSISNCSLSA